MNIGRFFYCLHISFNDIKKAVISNRTLIDYLLLSLLTLKKVFYPEFTQNDLCRRIKRCIRLQADCVFLLFFGAARKPSPQKSS